MSVVSSNETKCPSPIYCGPEKGRFFVAEHAWDCLTAESVQGPALSFQGVDHIHGGDGLALGVLRVGDGVTDDVLQENLEDPTGLLVDQSRNALHSATTGQTTYGRLRYALDVVAKDLAMTLGAPLAQPFSTFSSTGHFLCFCTRRILDAK